MVTPINWDADTLIDDTNLDQMEKNTISNVEGHDHGGGENAGKPIANNAIITAMIQDNAITSDKIGSAAVTAAKMGNNSVGVNTIVNSAVTADKIASGAVNNVKLASDSVTNAKIANNEVTWQKLKLADGSLSGSMPPMTAIGVLMNYHSFWPNLTFTAFSDVYVMPSTGGWPASDGRSRFALLNKEPTAYVAIAIVWTYVTGTDPQRWLYVSGAENDSISMVWESGDHIYDLGGNLVNPIENAYLVDLKSMDSAIAEWRGDNEFIGSFGEYVKTKFVFDRKNTPSFEPREMHRNIKGQTKIVTLNSLPDSLGYTALRRI